jgi:hypothetical protein
MKLVIYSTVGKRGLVRVCSIVSRLGVLLSNDWTEDGGSCVALLSIGVYCERVDVNLP